ncbi:MAG: Fe-S cluster assembly protein SufD [Candidatus Omnitrophica bacterium]|nr:Fe-S cluster assembly protein SufD [Candidatus Omnitrophota bacterium]
MMTEEQLPIKVEGLEVYQTKLRNNSPQWLKAWRQKGWDKFVELGFPMMKEEEWKYTSLADLAAKPFLIPTHHTLTEESQLKAYMDQADINVVLVNGVLWGELSNIKHLPEGLTIKSFLDAAVHSPTEVNDTVSKLTANDPRSLLHLNQALFLDGVFVKVENNAVIEPLVHIIHVTSHIEQDTAVFPRSLIHVGRGAKVSVLESYIGFTPNSYWSNAVVDMRVGENAFVQYCKAEGEASHTTHTATTRIWQERASQLEVFTFAHKAKLVRNNLTILLKGEGANTIMNGFYAIDGTQHVDNHTLLDIQQPNCTSYQLYKGILNDAAHAVFNGKIYVHPLAQKTNGYQLNKHLVLGKDARVDTKPELEIFADDVKCTHGATIGQLSDEEIFYLQSRCIKKELASQLLAKGFINDILNTITFDAIRLKLGKLLAKKFPEVKL